MSLSFDCAKVVAKEIRNIHPLLFQRMDDRQLDRLTQVMYLSQLR